MQLVEFLTECLDDDERTARATEWDGSGNRLSWELAASATIDVGEDEFYAGDRTIANHVVAHDPARVLREIDAKRRTLERHTPHSSGTADCSVHCERAHPGVQVCNHDGRRWPCPDALDLTAGYADRPGYRETWRP
ncbi:DUF6221 family protein [Streptomyces olivaceus]|uniref:DUF6221 family protein n=1 Tax=Streptomyces olivaceus TaxID=47716 RepID=UPI0037A7C7D4